MSASNEKMKRRMERENGVVDKRVKRQQEQEEKAKKEKLMWRIGMIAIAVFIFLSLILNSSLPYHMTAATVGETEYSASEMNYFYYNSYYQTSQYMDMFGVDSSKPLSSQNCPLTDGGSWKDYILENAINGIQRLEGIYTEVLAEGYELSEGGEAELKEEMAKLPEYAEEYGYRNVKKYLRAGYSVGVTETVLEKLMTKIQTIEEYSEKKYDSFEPTAEETEAYYYENLDNFREYDVHYYLVKAESEEEIEAEGTTVDGSTEGGLEIAMRAAKEIAGKVKDEASFESAVANYKEGETISHAHDTLKANLNEVYREWVADASRVVGDIEVFEADAGAYVVLYEGCDDNMYPAVTMRHILINSVDADGDGEYSEEEMVTAKAKIEEIEAEWQAGEQTEEAFIELVEKYSEDENTKKDGGLYEEIGKGNMVAEIDAFLFENGRKAGDTAILHGSNSGYDGYHLVYFVGEDDLYGLIQAKYSMMNDAYDAWENSLVDGVTVEYGIAKNLIGK